MKKNRHVSWKDKKLICCCKGHILDNPKYTISESCQV
jgi:hypothetical protein